MPYKFTKAQARRFLLRRHGLIGKPVFSGAQGIMDYIKLVGSIQFDPVDVCGKNADISLYSRVKGYKPAMLDELLYAEKPKPRKLIDFFDKNLCVIRMEDWPALRYARTGGGYAEAYDARGGEAVKQLKPLIEQMITERGCVSSHEIQAGEGIEWHWGAWTSLPRAALESMYFNGELVVHHKTRTHKHYSFTKDYVPEEILKAPLPFTNEDEKNEWLVKRRIGAVGLLWNKNSDAFLGMRLKSAERVKAFTSLLERDAITEVEVEGVPKMYARSEERPLLDEIAGGAEYSPRAAFIAPLDCFMWDRKVIEALFGFHYMWEIYTPVVKRKYGAYTLPFLYGEALIGRADLTRADGKIIVSKLWKGEGSKWTKRVESAFEKCVADYGKVMV